MLPLGSKVRFLGQLTCIVVPDVVLHSGHADTRPPPAANLPDAGLPSLIVRLQRRVLAVLGPSGFAQVQQLVVRPVAVPVVEVCRWEHAMHVEPRQTMMLVVLAVDHGRPVAARAGRTYDGADRLAALATFQVCEITCQRVVRQEFFEAGLGQHGAPISVVIRMKGRRR